mgnify:FL=1
MNFTEAKTLAEKYLMHAYNPYPLVLAEGKGAYLYDTEGKAYLDFLSGIAVNSLGYGHEGVLNAIFTQAAKLMHTSNFFYTEPTLRLAEKLSQLSGLEDGKVFFCNSGAEANETAFKLARLHGKGKGKNKVVACRGSFHGRTMGSLTLTGQSKYHDGFEPLVPNVVHTEFNNVEALAKDLTSDTCALFVECIQGEGGVVPATKEYLKKARELCDQLDILLVIDEVQTGVGRTGTFFAYEGFGVKPDIVTMAKALGGGLPIGAVIASGKAAVFTPGKHGATFGGNAVAASAALAVLDQVANPEFLADVSAKAELLKSKIPMDHPLVKEVRGIGLMLGIVVTVPPGDVAARALELGLIVGTAGTNAVRLVPPLTVTAEEIQKAADLLVQSLNSFLK